MLLGLTFDQARVYLALLQASPATVKEIAEVSKIARPEIYRILATLQEEGVVEKLITRPASFQAISALNVLPAMLKRKQKEQSELETITEGLLGDLKDIHSEKLQKGENEFTLVPKREAVIQRIKEAILGAEVSVCNITSKEMRFSSAIVEFEGAYRKASQQGVKIRVATSRHVPQGNALGIVKRLTEDPHFEVKSLDEPSPVVVSVMDDKVASVVLSATAHLADACAIWSSNPCFVILAKSYLKPMEQSILSKRRHLQETFL